MKTLKNIIALSLIAFSSYAFADKVIIKGEPVTIEKRDNVYYVPDSYRPTGDYYYINAEGTKRVCYKEKQPNISLEVTPFEVEMGGKRYTWTCYNSDATYFEIQP